MLHFRKVHRKIAPILFLPLLLTGLTGVSYSLAQSWLGFPHERIGFFLTLHEGRFLGNALVPLYVLLMGLGLISLIITGLTLIKRKGKASESKAPPKRDWRWFHRFLAPIAFLPLLVSGLTGMIYRVGTAWFDLPNDRVWILLEIHQGAYLGSILKPFYVLLVGIGLMGLLITGIQMTGIFRKKLVKSP